MAIFIIKLNYLLNSFDSLHFFCSCFIKVDCAADFRLVVLRKFEREQRSRDQCILGVLAFLRDERCGNFHFRAFKKERREAAVESVCENDEVEVSE